MPLYRRYLDDGTVRDVTRYGADPSGTRDSYAAFVAAHDALEPGDTFYIPGGTFLLSQTFVFSEFRAKFNGRGMLKPHGSFSDFLISFIAPGADPFIINVGLELHLESLRIDGDLQSRGVYFRQIYLSSLNNIRVYRPYGTGIRMEYSYETSWNSVVIDGGLQRQASWLGSVSDWDNSTTWEVGEYVKRDYDDYAGGTSYDRDDFVTDSGRAYRSLADSNQGNTPSSSPTSWQEVPYEYFEAMIEHSGRDPHSSSIYTTNSATPANRYWKQVYPEEAAIELVNDVNGTLDNQYFYGLVMRQNDHRTLIRIDSQYDDRNVNLIRFIGGQIHSITSDELAYLDTDHTVADHSQLIQIGRALDCHFEGMHIRCAVGNSTVTIVQIGAVNPAKTAARIRFHDCEISSPGSSIWGITMFPSIPNYGEISTRGTSFSFDTPASCVPIVNNENRSVYDFLGVDVETLSLTDGSSYELVRFVRVVDRGGTVWLMPVIPLSALS